MSEVIYVGLSIDEIKTLLYYLSYSENTDATILYDKLKKELEE